jgi:hypothetical protein
VFSIESEYRMTVVASRGVENSMILEAVPLSVPSVAELADRHEPDVTGLRRSPDGPPITTSHRKTGTPQRLTRQACCRRTAWTVRIRNPP